MATNEQHRAEVLAVHPDATLKRSIDDDWIPVFSITAGDTVLAEGEWLPEHAWETAADEATGRRKARDDRNAEIDAYLDAQRLAGMHAI